MHDTPDEFDQLDKLVRSHPPATGPADFPELVMQRIATISPTVPIWQQQSIQWLVASIGLFFSLGRLLSYIFSAWLPIELAG